MSGEKEVSTVETISGSGNWRLTIRREAAGRPVLLVTHDAADAAALEAEVVQL